MSANNPDDPTVDLSPPAPKTTPVLEQILERINTVGEELASFRQEANAGFDALENEVKLMRRDMRDYHKQLRRVQTEQYELQERAEELECKAS